MYNTEIPWFKIIIIMEVGNINWTSIRFFDSLILYDSWNFQMQYVKNNDFGQSRLWFWAHDILIVNWKKMPLPFLKYYKKPGRANVFFTSPLAS